MPPHHSPPPPAALLLQACCEEGQCAPDDPDDPNTLYAIPTTCPASCAPLVNAVWVAPCNTDSAFRELSSHMGGFHHDLVLAFFDSCSSPTAPEPAPQSWEGRPECDITNDGSPLSTACHDENPDSTEEMCASQCLTSILGCFDDPVFMGHMDNEAVAGYTLMGDVCASPTLISCATAVDQFQDGGAVNPGGVRFPM